MTLFSLLIIMAFERITAKSERWHVATWCEAYFDVFTKRHWITSLSSINMPMVILLAGLPALTLFAALKHIPLIFVFAINLVLLWVCLGCPVTRKTYKRYLQSANREDFVACSLHSEEFGNHGGNLDNVGKQLVLVNYRQYVSVIILFVFTGIVGLVFYSIIKELSLQSKRKDKRIEDKTAADKLLFLLDWFPVRLAALGFMIVGHFSRAVGAWIHLMTSIKMNTYDALGSVATAAEEVDSLDHVIDEPLQLVKLVKRNVVFLLMLIAVATMVGLLN